MLAAAALGATALPAQQAADPGRPAPLLPDAACAAPAGESGAAPEPRPVLVDGLGFAGIEADSDHPEARAWFAQGARLVWAFDEAEAVRAFREAQRIDPDCALCHWGEAWALSPTINLRDRKAELPAARAAAERALARIGRLDERGRLLVRAMDARTNGEEFDKPGYAALLETAALRLPEDDLIATLAADARMQATPYPDLQPGSLAQRLLERVLARSPDHGGAIHFYIHLTDWVDRPDLAEPHADRLARIAPAASHLVHMPSHTFFGVGRYADAAATNLAAIAADRGYEARAKPPASTYRRLLLRHNMQFAIISALARGDGATALDVSGQYRRAFLTGDAVDAGDRLLGSAAAYAAGLHAPVGEVLAGAAPEHVLDRVLHHYARGEAQARAGDAAGVQAEAEAIAAIRDKEAQALGNRTGAALAEIYEKVLAGRAAMLAGDWDNAADAYRAAMRRQLGARFGGDPPIFWYSSRRSLAAALIAAGDFAGARDQLHASLRRWPDDPLALYALSLAQRALGEAGAADRALQRARSLWAGELWVPLARI